jgi:nucleotide-binding universal stress UspA family protein
VPSTDGDTHPPTGGLDIPPADAPALEPTASTHRIVVGFDGSVGSTRALDWAISQAQRTGAVLDVVTAWMFPMAIGYAFTTTVDEVRRGALHVVDLAIRHVAEVAPEVVVRGEATEQSPAPALVTASKSADLLVVGSRGMGGFRELLVGSVGQYCVRHARCSVAVVR